MNNSYNYSGFIDLFLNSGDDFEPYGCVDDLSQGIEAKTNKKADQSRQHHEWLHDETGKK